MTAGIAGNGSFLEASYFYPLSMSNGIHKREISGSRTSRETLCSHSRLIAWRLCGDVLQICVMTSHFFVPKVSTKYEVSRRSNSGYLYTSNPYLLQAKSKRNLCSKDTKSNKVPTTDRIRINSLGLAKQQTNIVDLYSPKRNDPRPPWHTSAPKICS
jgi:hypothetical protein